MATEVWRDAEEITEDEELEEDMPTFEHGIICTRLIRHIGNFLDGKNIGEVVDGSAEYRYLGRKMF